MRLLGYVYSNGTILCVGHGEDIDDGNETGSPGGVFNTDEAFTDVVCDVPGCGVILEQNAYEDEEEDDGDEWEW